MVIIPPVFSCRKKELSNTLELNIPTKLFDGKRCWCHPRAGIVPNSEQKEMPRVVMTMNNLDLAGSDVFYGMFGLHTNNMATDWTKPQELKTLAPRYEIIDGIERPVAVSDFWPKWHSKSKILLGTGHTVVYTPDWKVRNPRPRNTSYSVYDPENNSFSVSILAIVFIVPLREASFIKQLVRFCQVIGVNGNLFVVIGAARRERP